MSDCEATGDEVGQSVPADLGISTLSLLDEYHFVKQLRIYFASKGVELIDEDCRTGHMAVVRRGRTVDGRDVAIKVYGEGVNSDLFEAEERAFEALGSHSSLVERIDSGKAELQWGGKSRIARYLVLEWGEPSLRDEMELQGGILPPDEAILVLLDICRAAQHLHHRQFRHQDIKPDNVIRVVGQWKLIDLSVAEKVHATEYAGADGYEPPERKWKRLESPFRIDIYNLGATLYELLAGRLPRPRAGLLPPPLGRYNRLVSPDINYICRMCMHPSPKFSYESVDQLIGDIEKVVKGDKLLPITETRRHRLLRVMGALPATSTILIVAALTATYLVGSSLAWQIQVSLNERHAVEERVARLVAWIAETRVKLDQERHRSETSLRNAVMLIQQDQVSPSLLVKQIQDQDFGIAHTKEAITHCKNGLNHCESLPSGRMRSEMASSFQDMLQEAESILTRYQRQGEDLGLRWQLEEIRLSRALSLSLRRQHKDEVFDFGHVADQYADFFLREFEFDPYSSSFDPLTEAKKFTDRLGRRQFAVALVDYAFTRILACVLSPLSLVRHQVAIENIRQVAEAIDDQDAWTRRFHSAFRPTPWDLLRLKSIYRNLARSADVETVPIAKLMIVAEVLWENDIDEAIRFLERVRQAHRHDPWASHMLGEVLIDRGRPADEHRVLALRLSAYEQDPDSAVFAFLVGNSYHSLKEYSEAEKFYWIAVQKNPSLNSCLPKTVSERIIGNKS